MITGAAGALPETARQAVLRQAAGLEAGAIDALAALAIVSDDST